MVNPCEICRKTPKSLIKIPSDVGYWVCYDCFSYWMEDYTLDELLQKIRKHWRNQDL